MLTYPAVTKLIYLADKAIEEITIVTDYDKRTVEVEKRLLEHVLRLEVKMVCWLVEDKKIDRLQQQFENCKTCAFTT